MNIARLPCILVILGFLLVSCLPSNEASFEAGKQAYDRGDYAGALEQWGPLGNRGHAEAQHWIGHMYAMGEGVHRNDAESTRWFRRAAEQGHDAAQGALGDAYMFGWGVREDLVLAYKWKLLAVMQGDPWSEGNIDLLRKEMTRSQIRRGERLAHEWQATRE